MTILKNNLITIIHWILVVSLLSGCFLSLPLWTGNRLFPYAPMIRFLSSVPTSFLFYSFCIVSIVNLVKPHKWLFLSNLFFLGLLIAQDQNRLQPWVYIYILFVVSLCVARFRAITDAQLIPIFQIILIFIYFWSGIHKINENFIHTAFHDILSHFFQTENEVWLQKLLPLGYVIPLIEMLISIGFMTSTYRNTALFLAISTHAFIILYLCTAKQNLIVIPWNISMICLDLILFNKLLTENRFRNLRTQFQPFWTLIYLLIVAVMPLFNWAGYCDDYLAFSLYSQKNKLFYIAISDAYLNRFNHQLDDYFSKMDNDISGGRLIDVNKWALKELNVPVYPEYRVFKQMSQHFCKYDIPSTDLIFLVYEQPITTQNLVKWSCIK